MKKIHNRLYVVYVWILSLGRFVRPTYFVRSSSKI